MALVDVTYICLLFKPVDEDTEFKRVVVVAGMANIIGTRVFLKKI